MKNLLQDLLAKKISFEPGKDLQTPAVAAILRRDDGTVHAAITADLALVATVGTALAMSPARVAQEQVKTGKLSELSREATAEVFNVMSSLYNASGAPHVKLAEVSFHPADVMEALQPCLDATGRKALYEVTVGDYPVGHLNLLLVEVGASHRAGEIQSGPAVNRTGFDAWR
ncbi:MAG: hypothetical protein GY913_09570 [Proteobacteria bacterium]|nr:hypothetical protein [Pseudomonadota bacterium]